MRPAKSAMVLATMASPSPVPCPGGRVVKKGSKTVSMCSRAIPGPVSATTTRTTSVPGSMTLPSRLEV